MGRVETVYRWLADGAAPECDQILGAGLARAEPEYFARIQEMLLDRGNDHSIAALIGCYARLSAEDRAALWIDPKRARNAAALALRGGSVAARAGALEMLRDRPSLKLAHLIADALRHEDPAVHRNAAQALRRAAEVVADLRLGGSKTAEIQTGDDLTDTTHLIRALREALRTFDLHCRLEVLEACLWFSHEQGELLWHKLDDRKSQCGEIVAEHLELWNSPRMAPMLLESLARQPWRRYGREMLMKWRSREQLCALLRHSELLDDPQVRRHLAALKSPPWFTEVAADLADLPVELRVRAPLWAARVGFSEEERVGLLTRWCATEDSELRRASVDALAAMNSPPAMEALTIIARAQLDIGELTELLERAPEVKASQQDGRSAIEGENAATAAIRKGQDEDVPEDDDAPQSAWALARARAGEFDLFWQVCRRRALRDGDDLIELIRTHIDIWRNRLRDALASPDPRDRILVLRVIGTSTLAAQFSDEIQPLLADPVEGIRKLASALVELTQRNGEEAVQPVARRAAVDSPGGVSIWPTLRTAAGQQSSMAILRQLMNEDLDRAGATELIDGFVGLVRTGNVRTSTSMAQASGGGA